MISIPQPVIGGVGVVLVGHLFGCGLVLLVEDMNRRNGLIAGLSISGGLIASSGRFFPEAFPIYTSPLLNNGVALGGLAAGLLTLMRNNFV